MRNGSSSICCSSSPVAMGLPQVLGSQAPHHGWWYRQLNASAREVTMEAEEMVRMPLLNGLVSLNVLLLVAYLLLFLLAKLFHRLCRARDHGRDSRTEIAGRSDNTVLAAAAAADVAAGERQADTMFWFDEAVFHHDTALLDDQGKDHLSYTGGGAAHGLQADGSCTFPAAESTARISFSPRQEDHPCDDDEAAAAAVANGKDQGESKDILTVSVAADVPTAPDEYHRQNIPVDVTPENVSVQVSEKPKGRGGQDGHDGHGEEEEEAGIPDVKRLVNSGALADTKKVLLPEGGGGGGRLLRPRRDEEEDNGDSSCRFGASTLTSESTSKSSVEWHGSGATKDAYSDLFSSSSRRSSARWESYTLFRKYDEDMVYFHRVGAQKLTETESFRSIKYQPRSMSQRITHKLSMAPTPPPIGLRDPYPELERVYVAQICLTWEALNWNYTSFRRHNGGGGGGTMTMLEDRCCPARVAQEFQQFQVLLYRFIENEPFEQGRRPEIYARMKNSSPKLLLVPEFREEEDEKDDLISAVQFLHILEESIRTFMAFLRADKRSHYQMFREMVRRRTSAADQAIVITLKKANKHKKSRLKDLTRPRRCLKRSKARDDEVVPVLLGLIDLKVVARVLRMPEITDQQLHWCEEKMNRVRVDVRQGKLQRDPSPLFFPAH